MKVLFAVNNESISEAIIKKYQQEYKEIISSKNVYYFDAITRELQKDKTYDRIVISEDVEPFTNNNYGVIDNFIFKRLDSISDEATTQAGQDIPIILICADRRAKSEDILVKLFGIGIYSALLGQDRTISKVCELINKPRSKKDAKLYYRIDADDVDYKAEGEGDVNEVEIQNILAHYKRLGKNEEEYVKSFDNIAEQYTDAQLKVICKFLPLNVKAVLEAKSQKYQELITFGTATPSKSQTKGRPTAYVPNQDYQIRKEKNAKGTKIKEPTKQIDVLEKSIGKSKLSKPVVIPKGVGITQKVEEKVEEKKDEETALRETIRHALEHPVEPIEDVKHEDVQNSEEKNIESQENSQENNLNPDEIENILQSLETDMEEEPKRKRGRPRKVQEEVKNTQSEEPKRKRGRPRKVQEIQEPEKNSIVEEKNNENEEVDLFGLGSNEAESEESGGLILPGLEDDADNSASNSNVEQNSHEEPIDLFALDFEEENTSKINTGADNTNYETPSNFSNVEESRDLYNVNQSNADLEGLLSMSNKLVAFVGTSKNGTSFLVNSMAEMLSNKGIKTAILDLTKNKNAYYIYTQNDEALREIAFSCVDNLQNGVAKGIDVNKNLTVFTTLPGRNVDFNNSKEVLKTLMENYSLVIMDCDFETNYTYFNYAQEIYLVQSYDILTIQPLTTFLKDLQARSVLDPNKLRIVLNKVLRVKSLTDRVVIGGMSSYNSPSMSGMTNLFNMDNVKYCTIPFDQEAYSRYLSGLVNCEISTRGYPKNIMASLEKLANMVYPLLSNDRPANKFNTYNARTSNFSSSMNETLNKMKNRY